LISGDPIKNDDIMDNMLLSLKEELVAENEDISFSDEESETSPKKSVTLENNSIPAIKTSSMLINLYI